MTTKNLLHWAELAISNISAPEMIAISINIATFIFNVMNSIYLWIVIVICDTMMILAHGAYLEAKPDTEKGPWYTPAPLLLRLSSTAIIFILLAEGRSDGVISTYAWYTLTITAICHAFFCILLSMHAKNDSWLAGTDGRVGTPNWISIGRMALAIVVPHLFVTQPFGTLSNTIATIFMIIAIVTDAADGYLARKLNQITKAGKALDPLGDKVIFYPMVVAFMIVSEGSGFLPEGGFRVINTICLLLMVARDVLVFVWFFLYYTKIPAGIGASMIDKVRMATMCTWLGVATLSMTLSFAQERLAYASFICMILIAILSIISFFVDRARINDYI